MNHRFVRTIAPFVLVAGYVQIWKQVRPTPPGASIADPSPSLPFHQKTRTNIYSPLDSTKNQIRVLLLYPGHRTDRIVCELDVHSLDDHPQYTALSYHDGVPIRRTNPLSSFRGIYQYIRALYWKLFSDRPRSTQINGFSFDVSGRLATAFENLRREDEAVLLWVDVICVDQEDRDEMNDQMGKKARIFAQAEKICVWLGPAADNSDVAMGFIRRADAIDIRNYIVSHVPPWHALRNLFARSWWSQIGLVEELLGRENVTFQCGTEEVKLDALRVLAAKEASLRSLVRSGLYQGPKSAARWTLVPLETPYFSMLDVLHGGKEKHNAVKLSGDFWNWVYRTQSFATSLPREKIYTIYRCFGTKMSEDVSLHYTDENDDSETFKDFATNILMTAKHLELLQIAQLNTRTLKTPSWVPDFSSQSLPGRDFINCGYGADGGYLAWKRLTPDKVFEENYYPHPVKHFFYYCAWKLFSIRSQMASYRSEKDAGKDINMVGKTTRIIYGSNVQVSEDKNVLSLDGLVFDNIEFVDPAPNFNVSLIPGLEYLERWDFGPSVKMSLFRFRKSAIQWQSILASKEQSPYEAEGDGIDEAFARTLIADRIPSSTKLLPPPYSSIKGFKTYLTEPFSKHSQVPVNIQTYPYSISAMHALQGKAFMITDRGFMGIAPAGAQVGDLVCIFRKGDVPFVLRPIGGGYHELVGDCFVHGIMDGSFAREAKLEDVKVFHIK